MAAPVLAEVKPLRTPVRKFDTADLSQHGKWIVPRMLKTFPHFGDDRGVATFLQNVLWNNEYRVLFQDDSVALFQVVLAHGLSPQPVIWERFVWCQNPEDVEQQKYAADFYSEIARWAKTMMVETIIVEENSDVPHETIKGKLGRIFQRQQQFARV